MHPSQVLFQDHRVPVCLPACDHYAGVEKFMHKALALQQELGPVFDITLDCEDGAPAGDEAGHARLIGSLIAGEANRFNRVGTRVHAPHHDSFEQDVETICLLAAKRLAYIMLPKVESVSELQQAIFVINHHRDRGLAAEKNHTSALPIHVLIETHGALQDVFAIAALPQVQSLSFGIMDFVSSHHGAIAASAMRSPQQFTHPLVVRAKIQIAAAAHAYGKVPSHNVTTDVRDPATVSTDAARAAGEFGYTRMWSIHPDQIKPIVDCFTPDTEEINRSSAILAQAQANAWGPTQYEGTLQDRASYRYYWTVLQRAKATGQVLPKSAACFV